MARRKTGSILIVAILSCLVVSGPRPAGAQAARHGSAPTPVPHLPVQYASFPSLPLDTAPDTAGELPAAAAPPASGATSADEAMSFARLRERLEKTLSQHSLSSVRVEANRAEWRVRARPADSDSATTSGKRAARVRDDQSARASGNASGADWSYSGPTGPAHWARLDPQWAACAADVPQAPIDVRGGIPLNLPAIEFDLPPAILTVHDDGRTIRTTVREGVGIRALGRRFELREITFHQPAEFRVEGRSYDLSAHLMLRDEAAQAAIVVVLFETGDMTSPRNPVVQTVLDHLPLVKGMSMPVDEMVELGALLPADRGYYNFIGGLSAPPCTPGAIWMVLREPVRVPPEQAAIFARVHPSNVRPVQPLAGRLIKQSE